MSFMIILDGQELINLAGDSNYFSTMISLKMKLTEELQKPN